MEKREKKKERKERKERKKRKKRLLEMSALNQALFPEQSLLTQNDGLCWARWQLVKALTVHPLNVLSGEDQSVFPVLDAVVDFHIEVSEVDLIRTPSFLYVRRTFINPFDWEFWTSKPRIVVELKTGRLNVPDVVKDWIFIPL
mgnify:CR=1 FL=1